MILTADHQSWLNYYQKKRVGIRTTNLGLFQLELPLLTTEQLKSTTLLSQKESS